MAMTCNTGGLWQQGGTDVAVDWYLAILLLFTILALVLTSVFVRLRGAEGERPWEPAVAEAAWESGPRDQAAARAGPEAGKEAVAKHREEAAEDPSPVVAENIPWQLPVEPHEPEPQEDAESNIPPLGASAGSSLGHLGQVEDTGDHTAFPSKAEKEDLDSEKEKLVVGELASTAATPAPVTSTAASFENSDGFKWPLGTLETCLLIVRGITMLAHIQNVFCPQPFCLISEVKQSRVWVLSGVR
ncbi:uncharacterized protein LOC133206787 [Neopsephotus bourkii]|uniref:uncharacterized protein LOC133206787 n=1 Tax=Neopsephotus bourkii TaxID=309878 RepID=UPI002AA5A98A|nr:uncharacterized protein LOC133206787 [Neopsephotus bourkii]